ncbi:hypothetical protein PTTG_26181 [Puccinia triticina 1-1 BBBD Race 1]|uniref:Uncharacterized protein n=1 Tax=Puccinia triticina (isolate 1-1 / race 1 (BBBD)) TaxID=630390 RepID=A0A180GY14_PUCT1|nr:hypothetical protein PTTG_26181 [Puccinia triticina 1-1 BBBD Race 1]
MAPISQPSVPINARVGVPIRSESPPGLPDLNELDRLSPSAPGSPSELQANSSDTNHYPEDPAEHDAMERALRPFARPPAKSPQQSISMASTEIECVSGGKDHLVINRLPVRKLPHSPATDGAAGSGASSAIQLGSGRSAATRPEVSGIDQTEVDSLDGWVSNSSPKNSYGHQYPGNLNAAGRVLTMEQFLDHCNFHPNNPNHWALINISLVSNWSFFAETNLAKLRSMNYPIPLAWQLLSGAQTLIPTHYDQSPSH